MHVSCGRGSVLLRWRCRRVMLCTSGFSDDVMFSHDRLYGASSVFRSGETTASIPTGFCSMIQISKYTSRIARRGRSLPSTIALLLVCDRSAVDNIHTYSTGQARWRIFTRLKLAYSCAALAVMGRCLCVCPSQAGFVSKRLNGSICF